MQNLPVPRPLGALLAQVHVTMSDNANNESHRVDYMEGMVGHSIIKQNCFHHNIMLASKACAKADQAVLVDAIGDDRDTDIREFSSSNIMNRFGQRDC